MTTLQREQWELKEKADWWSAGQARRQETLGPATEMMLDMAGVRSGSRVLDVAVGTGESSLMGARRVGPTGYVLGVDFSASMLNVAAEAARNEGIKNVETRVMNAEALDLDADSFDAVISRIALMLFPSPAKALTEMRRVVKSNGRVAAIVFSVLEKNPYHGIVYDTAHRIGNIPLPPAGEPWMYALGKQAALENVYSSAGFLNVSVQAVPIVRRFASASEAIRRMRSGGGDVRQLINRLSESGREAAWAEVERQFKQFEGPNGLEIPGEVLIGVGTK
jgi:ubiquinone/menaquinone biosynthesis C-methylase UbiE